MAREFWKAPRIWNGLPVVVMATGESFTQEQADYVRGKAKVIAVNDAYKRAPWADLFYAADAKWWHAYYPEVAKLGAPMVCAQDSVTFPSVKVIRHDSKGEKYKFDDPACVQGNNSGAESIHLAYHMNGGALIVALGCDCTGRHFFGDHQAALKTGGNTGTYAVGFEHVAKELKARGVRVVNCSAISVLKCFEKARLEDVL